MPANGFDIALRGLGAHPQAVQRDAGHEGLADGGRFPGFHVALRHDPAVGCPHQRVFKLFPGLCQGRAGRLQPCLGGLVLGLGLVHGRPGNQLSGEHALDALIFGGRFGFPCLGFVEVRPGAFHARLLFGIAEPQ